jgi:hypothetical protein
VRCSAGALWIQEIRHARILSGMFAPRKRRRQVTARLSTFNLSTTTLRKDSLASELVTNFAAMKRDARFGFYIHRPNL